MYPNTDWNIDQKFTTKHKFVSNTAKYIDVKSAKLVQILIGISTKIAHKNKFRVQILIVIST